MRKGRHGKYLALSRFARVLSDKLPDFFGANVGHLPGATAQLDSGGRGYFK